MHRGLLTNGFAGFAAVLADTVHFERLRARLEAVLLRLIDEETRDALVADLDRTRANVADQERHLVRFVRMWQLTNALTDSSLWMKRCSSRKSSAR